MRTCFTLLFLIRDKGEQCDNGSNRCFFSHLLGLPENKSSIFSVAPSPSSFLHLKFCSISTRDPSCSTNSHHLTSQEKKKKHAWMQTCRLCWPRPLPYIRTYTSQMHRHWLPAPLTPLILKKKATQTTSDAIGWDLPGNIFCLCCRGNSRKEKTEMEDFFSFDYFFLSEGMEQKISCEDN